LEGESDERLVALARAGNAAAFETIYARYHSVLLAYCRHILRSPEDGEDAVQQTFLSAHAALLASDAPVHLRGWLFAIARNRCISTLRGRREEPARHAFEVATPSLADQVEQREDVRHLLDDLAGLPQSQRTALVLAEVAALSHRDIAEVVGGSQARVTALVFRARASLLAARDARHADCREIRAQLAQLPSDARPHRRLRRHLALCDGCRGFDGRSGRGRALGMAALPLAPVALEPSAGASGVLATAAKSIAVKLAIGGAVAATVSGGAVVVDVERNARHPRATPPISTAASTASAVPTASPARRPAPVSATRESARRSASVAPSAPATARAALHRLGGPAWAPSARRRLVAQSPRAPAATPEPRETTVAPRSAPDAAPAPTRPTASPPARPGRAGAGHRPTGASPHGTHSHGRPSEPHGRAEPATPTPAAPPAAAPPRRGVGRGPATPPRGPQAHHGPPGG
jgi:RNA polymerase sigma factor (sigma-70 family)